MVINTPSKLYYCNEVQVYYCNGMTTSHGDAKQVAEFIEGKIEKNVELVHNDSTPTWLVVSTVALIAIGLIAVVFSLFIASKVGICTVLGAICFGIGAYLYYRIQQGKNQVGSILKDKVLSHLNQSPNEKAVLILHSQGTDIGQKVLSELREYRHRINVVTIGGMRQITKAEANKVYNIAHIKDIVPQWIGHIGLTTIEQEVRDCLSQNQKTKSVCVEEYGESTVEQYVILATDCISTLCHGALEYLNEPKTIKKIHKALIF